MDEGAGDQLDNSNSYDRERSEQSSSSSSSSSAAAAAAAAATSSLQHNNNEQLHQLASNNNPTNKNNSSGSNLPTSTSLSQSQEQTHQEQQQQQHQQLQSSSASPSSSSASLDPANQNSIQNSSLATKSNIDSALSANISSSAQPANNKHGEEPLDKAKSNNEHLPKRNPTDDLFSTKKWGVTPIRQDTPWELPPSPTQTNPTGPIGGPASVVANSAPTLPPGISQSGDSFRSGNSANEFGHAPAMVNNFVVDNMGANGLANSFGHMSLGGAGVIPSSRFDQPWRAPVAKPHQVSSAASPFANPNLMNPAPGGMQKSMLNSGAGVGGSSYIGMQQGGEFARAPGPASSMMDNNMTNKPFGMANRSSTWSAFGTPAPNEPEAEWPKTTSSGISAGNSTQPSNAFDLVPEFEPGKPWRGSMLMKSVEDDPTMTPGSMARSLAPQRKTIWSDETDESSSDASKYAPLLSLSVPKSQMFN